MLTPKITNGFFSRLSAMVPTPQDIHQTVISPIGNLVEQTTKAAAIKPGPNQSAVETLSTCLKEITNTIAMGVVDKRDNDHAKSPLKP